MTYNFISNTIEQFIGPHRWLSNFYPVKIMYEGYEYPSVEHAYQAAKYNLPENKFQIRKLTAGQAKRFANKNPIEVENWEERKEIVMESLLRLKFKNIRLRNLLKNTGNALIEEGNTWGDEFWGINLKNSRGKNKLGLLLMKIREEIL